MRGYGAPSSGSATSIFGLATASPFDWGYGDPNANGLVDDPYLDLGYGSVMPNRFFAVLVAARREINDDGGVLIRFRMGAWPDNGAIRMAQRSGPFRVKLVNAKTGDIYPQDMAGCHSGRIGKGIDCETDLRHEELSFVMPPVPPAEYNVEVLYGAGFVQKITIPKAFRVIHRGRNSSRYMGRSAIASRFNAGARTAKLEKPMGE